MAYIQYPKPRPSLPPAIASQLLEKVIASASVVNGDPKRYPCAVRTLVVFGSYLTDAVMLGDLDIGAEFVLVRPLQDLMQERPEWRGIHWEDRTVRALRVRKPNLVSIHRLEEVRRLGV